MSGEMKAQHHAIFIFITHFQNTAKRNLAFYVINGKPHFHHKTTRLTIPK
jgi:hypothetical protein